jgi:hypothetical protein
MALIVKNAKFKNTEVTAPEIYIRIQFTAMADGKRTMAMLLSGLNKELALSMKEVETNIPKNLILELEENQSQDLATIHEVVKEKLLSIDADLEIDIYL